MASILKVDTIQDQDGNNIINENADTITIGASGDTVNVVGTLQNNGSALASGITEADQWRLTANLTTAGDITSNLERNDTSGYGKIGTGMTESSGIFSFPSTGIYLIRAVLSVTAVPDNNVFLQLKISTDNFSSDSTGALIYASGDGSAGGLAASSFDFLFDVTNTSTHKLKFVCGSIDPGSELRGNTGYNQTHFTFIRLGDT